MGTTRKVQDKIIAAVRGKFPELTDLFKIRAQEEGYHGSLSAYFYWLGLYDVFLRKTHKFTPWLSRQAEERQIEAVQMIVETFDSKDKPRGLYEALVEEETHRIRAQLREAEERVRELEQENAKLRSQLGPELPLE